MNIESQRIEALRSRIATACRAAGREPASVRLLAVSKRQPAARVRAFYLAGQRAFGENVLQEARAKQPQLADLDIEWHFIGHIQSNKTAELAAHFQWVQSVDRERVLRRLADQRPADLPPLRILLQVNIDREPQKSGAMPEQLAALAELAARLPGIDCRGLMAIPRLTGEPDLARDSFRRVRERYLELCAAGHDFDTLSMGMSADLEWAIAEGSTMVRVGTDLMGPRNSAPGQ